MTYLWTGSGMAFVGLAAILILRETRKEFVPYIVVAFGLITMVQLLPLWKELADWETVFPSIGEYGKILMKALGIAVLTETACEICRSTGENGIAGYVSMTGKAELFLLCFPLLQKLVDMAVGFMA